MSDTAYNLASSAADFAVALRKHIVRSVLRWQFAMQSKQDGGTVATATGADDERMHWNPRKQSDRTNTSRRKTALN